MLVNSLTASTRSAARSGAIPQLLACSATTLRIRPRSPSANRNATASNGGAGSRPRAAAWLCSDTVRSRYPAQRPHIPRASAQDDPLRIDSAVVPTVRRICPPGNCSAHGPHARHEGTGDARPARNLPVPPLYPFDHPRRLSSLSGWTCWRCFRRSSTRPPRSVWTGTSENPANNAAPVSTTPACDSRKWSVRDQALLLIPDALTPDAVIELEGASLLHPGTASSARLLLEGP